MAASFSDPNLISALRLIRGDGIGPVLYERLVSEFGSAARALDALHTLRGRGGKPLLAAPEKDVTAEIKALEKLGGHWLVKGSAPYPAALAATDDAPPVLSALGDVTLLDRPMIGIVGARNASVNGRRLATALARELGQAGFVIVSGLARGIDTAAHEAAMETGTIAVVANGVDIAYPPENKKLHEQISINNLIISENSLSSQPASALFPRRNRIISGLSSGVIIIEAAAKSGSLITARFALDQGRDVFAVPGHPLDPRAAGPNGLIKSGQAHLVESAIDVLDQLGAVAAQAIPAPKKRPVARIETDQTPCPPPARTTDQARHAVLDCLGPAPCTIDQIVAATGLPTPEILGFLMEMELSGRVERLSGDRVALV